MSSSVLNFIWEFCAYLDKCTDDTKAGEPQVLEGPRLAGGVEERVEEEGHMGCKAYARPQKQAQIMSSLRFGSKQLDLTDMMTLRSWALYGSTASMLHWRRRP